MKQSEFERIFRDKWATSPDIYSPLKMSDLDFDPSYPTPDELRIEAIFTVEWKQKKCRFFGQFISDATPRSIQRATDEMQDRFPYGNNRIFPAILMTHLTNNIVEELDKTDVSGFDLNGNYYVQTSELVAVRLDQPNEYPESRGIKKIYSHNSSIVGRFLLREDRNFKQVNDIYEGIQESGGGISLSTVSKVLSGLADDLIIEKKRGNIQLLQPAELLSRLKAGYRSPRIDAELRLKLPDSRENQQSIFNKRLGESAWIWSGESSAQAYTTTTPTVTPIAFTSEPLLSKSPLRMFENERFYNCIVKQTQDSFVYFDRLNSWASQIETFLALSQLDKRERQLARSIEAKILAEFHDHV